MDFDVVWISWTRHAEQIAIDEGHNSQAATDSKL